MLFVCLYVWLFDYVFCLFVFIDRELFCSFVMVSLVKIFQSNSDLLDQIREVKLMEEDEALEMGREAATIRHHFMFCYPGYCNAFI